MRKTVIKACVVIGVFFIALFSLEFLTNRGNTDMTVEMAGASLPLACVRLDGEAQVNPMRGYLDVMEPAFMRESLTPVGADRSLTVDVTKFGQAVTGLAFEVRSVDGSRLVESTQITDYAEEGDVLSASFQIKDLIAEDTEYNLVLLVSLEDGRTVRYYTRIIQTEAYHTSEMVAFARWFQSRTLAGKEEARAITRYLESNAEGDNTTFHKVDIHSSFSQITWGELAPEQIGEASFTVREDGRQMTSLSSQYVIRYEYNGQTAYALVEEFYRLRYSPERIYLLEFERTMDQILDDGGSFAANDKIIMGITEEDMQIRESDGGSNFAFVANGRLFGYSVQDNRMARIFSFYDRNNADERTVYNGHDIKILNVDETGNIVFLVYGYMNRGRHEGRVGVQVNYYNAQTNTVEEDAFLPYDKSAEILRTDVEKLAYLNNSRQLFLMLDGTIYEVNLEERSCKPVVEGLADGSYQVSEDNRMLAWQEENQRYASSSLVLMNLNSGRNRRLRAGEGEYIMPLGFMEEDLIYGLAKQESVITEPTGNTLFPMYKVRIENEDGDVLKTYQEDGIFIMSSLVEENRITLYRASLNEDGRFRQEEEERIMNNEAEKEGVNHPVVAAVDKYERIVQIETPKAIDRKNLKLLTPKEVLFEGGRELPVTQGETVVPRYYVYGKNRVLGIFTDAGAAVALAYEEAGAVTDEQGSYIYKRGDLAAKNQIMAIKAEAQDEKRSSLAVCLDTILSYEGVVRDSTFLLNQGRSVRQILEEYLPDARLLDLTGCSVDSVLFYVNQDIPVLALQEDGSAVLIIGFNELNTVWMDPKTGTIYKKGMKDSREWFAENGNRFLTYIRKTA